MDEALSKSSEAEIGHPSGYKSAGHIPFMHGVINLPHNGGRVKWLRLKEDGITSLPNVAPGPSYFRHLLHWLLVKPVDNGLRWDCELKPVVKELPDTSNGLA